MPLRPARAFRKGIIGAPVARTTLAAGTTALIVHGIERRRDRRQNCHDDEKERRVRRPDRN